MPPATSPSHRPTVSSRRPDLAGASAPSHPATARYTVCMYVRVCAREPLSRSPCFFFWKKTSISLLISRHETDFYRNRIDVSVHRGLGLGQIECDIFIGFEKTIFLTPPCGGLPRVPSTKYLKKGPPSLIPTKSTFPFLIFFGFQPCLPPLHGSCFTALNISNVLGAWRNVKKAQKHRSSSTMDMIFCKAKHSSIAFVHVIYRLILPRTDKFKGHKWHNPMDKGSG
ncbi:hypothetical protein BDA96_01G368500 [Sorghum bicolor]|uniref:Uncharacterized protein n=2 Tax=Sorghum bicolor TaxID=4558 RepID=A0A921V0L5_SORBI|nr:hypothetical protein BDA96_01G368500 [Sorghum bicolor]OQU92443.1 hypothetical protein SORBI_3001G345333 [Sorghum bicolor]